MAIRKRGPQLHRQAAEIRTVLLRHMTRDFFGDVRRLGPEAVRTYWEEHREEILAEFAATHQHAARCGVIPKDDDGQCRPFGWHAEQDEGSWA